MIKIYVPRDSTALSVGADQIAAQLEGQENVEVIRNGSRGLFWLEPMVEVETAVGRVAYGPVSPRDVDSLIEDGLLEGFQLWVNLPAKNKIQNQKSLPNPVKKIVTNSSLSIIRKGMKMRMMRGSSLRLKAP